MHDNANITFQLKESKNALETILSIQPRDTGSGGSGKSSDEIVVELCTMFEEKLPLPLKKDQAPSAAQKKADGGGAGGGAQNKKAENAANTNLQASTVV